MRKDRRRLRLVCCVLLAWLLPLLSIASDRDPEPRYEISIPAMRATAALELLAKQTNAQLLFSYDAVGSITANGVSGRLTLSEALTKLLEGTGLFSSVTTARVITVTASTPKTDQSGEPSVTKSKKWAFLGAIATFFAGSAHSALADETGPQPSSALEEIVVTAQKRSERLQDVPTSIAVMSGQQLERTEPQSLVDLTGYFPGLTVSSQGSPGQTQLTLRGIGTTAFVGALVGTYIDEAPIGSSGAQIRGNLYSPDLLPYDLERIEVLSGPQGTLYGAAAMGGLLKYVLKDPALDEFSGRIGGIINYIDHSGSPGGGVRAAVDIPLVNGVFGIRLSGYDQKTQGYIDNVGLNRPHSNADTQQGGRLAALWKANDDLSVKFSAMFQNIRSDGNSAVTVDPTTREPLYGDFSYSTAVPDTFRQRAQLYSLAVNWDLKFASLVSATSWQSAHTDVVIDDTPPLRGLVSLFTGGAVTDGVVPFPATRTLDKFVEEVRLVSPTGQRFEWMLGAFFTHETSENFQPLYALQADGTQIPGLNPFLSSDVPWNYREIAGFANGTIHFNDSFALSAGARYAENHQNNSSTTYGALYGSLTPLPTEEFSSHQGVATWMVSPQWFISKDVMLYGRVATGYRPGGWSFASPPSPTTYRADTLTNYEVGLKSSYLDNRLVVNFAIYDIEWRNIQENVVDPVTQLRYLGNGNGARSRGGEVAVNYSVSSELRLGATLGYTNARLTADAPGIGGLNGDRLPTSAPLTGSLTADYHHALSTDRQFTGGLAFRYSGAMWTDVQSATDATQVRQPKPLDLYAGMGFGIVETRLFLRNVFNSEPDMQFVRTPAYWAPNQLTYFPIPPRTIGLSVDVKF